MRRVLPALFALLAAASPALAAAGSYPPPSSAERAEARRHFTADAVRTLSDRSGDLFVLPRKYNFLTGHPTEKKTTSHIRRDGRNVAFATAGVSHGASWDYDSAIPLVLWGPGFIRQGQVSRRPAAQQDLVPTIAQLIGAPRPSDARGRVLEEAIMPTGKKPKVVLTLVFDQGGDQLYRFHPGQAPFIDRLRREGTDFERARVSHLDQETGVGHVAIGTGAFPKDHGMPSNEYFHGGRGGGYYGFWGPEDLPAPYMLMSPTLGDVWLKATRNQALLLSYCYADRAAIGMGGHGSFYRGNKKPWVYYLDADTGTLATNPRYYALPPSAAAEPLKAWGDRVSCGAWLGHPLKRAKDYQATPYLPAWEGEHLARVLEAEPFGQDDVTDLIYVSLKSTDITGHIYGQESIEAGEVLKAQDRQAERLVRLLEKKVGRENLVVALSADHGAPPLPELSGGSRLLEQRLLDDLNARFDKLDDGFPLAQFVTGTQVWIDQSQLEGSGATLEAIKAALLAYEVDGKPFFETAYTRQELESMVRLDLAP
ncbi:MAG: alkaline phosphatase family protein [Candidatus Sericytochromatia bacterium]